ncbi:MAG: hypothetical protein AAFX10_08715, partial [Pseudomonadota bacterium]
RTMDEIWNESCAELGDDMPGQDETIQLLAQLYRSNAMQMDVVPDLAEIHRRHEQEKRSKLLQYLKSPLAVRLPVWNPEGFLERTRWLAPLAFNRWTGLAWLAIVIAALMQVVVNWDALAGNFADQAFSIGNWLAIACIYPFVKLFHEFGHAYAVKRWGGEVHEMGLMFLVLIPVPYVDASSSALYPNKYHRMFVSGAGIIVELFLAAIAALMWFQVEPGLFRALLFNVMLIGGVSTVLFNGNPLLKFDAYHILADWLEIPNLGQRANRYVGYLVRRYLLKLREETPSASARESLWLFTYSVASFIYRLFVMLGIALYVATEFFFIGVMLAGWSLYQSLLAPLVRIVKVVWPESLMRNYRPRLILTSLGFAGALYLALFAIPVPSFTVVQGVYWAPEESQLHAGADCFVRDVLVKPGQRVEAGDEILRCESIELRMQSQTVVYRLEELQMQRRSALTEDVVEAAVLQDEIGRLTAEKALVEQRLAALTIRSPVAGTVQLERLSDLEDRFLRRGTYLGYVGQDGVNTVRVVVPQHAISRVRSDTDAIAVRSSSRFGRIVDAAILREVPAANKTVVAPALTLEGGGTIAVDPTSTTEIQAMENWFQFELSMPDDAAGYVGERVFARFRHGSEPLGVRLWRAVRLVFLEQLGI